MMSYVKLLSLTIRTLAIICTLALALGGFVVDGRAAENKALGYLTLAYATSRQSHKVPSSVATVGYPLVWTYNPSSMLKPATVQIAYYHTNIFAHREVLAGLAVGLLLAPISYWVGLLSRSIFLLSVLSLLVVYALVVIVAFFFNLLNWRSLPRRLSRKQKRQMVEYLGKYRDDQRTVLVKVCYDPDRERVKEARDYADDIVSVLRQGGWGVEVASQESQDENEHRSGLWVYGQAQRGHRDPFTREIIAAAFGKAGVEIHQDHENSITWTFIVVGHRRKRGTEAST
jgi:hypothetical protein